MKKIVCALLAAITAIGCVNDPAMERPTNHHATILGSSTEAARGVLMVRMANGDATLDVEGATVKAMLPQRREE